jgi:hypothetical protein
MFKQFPIVTVLVTRPQTRSIRQWHDFSEIELHHTEFKL